MLFSIDLTEEADEPKVPRLAIKFILIAGISVPIGSLIIFGSIEVALAASFAMFALVRMYFFFNWMA